MDNTFNFQGSINVEQLKHTIEEKKKASEKLFWKPQEGNNLVRIIPYKHAVSPFNELYFHYLKGETVLCAKKSLGRADCPLCDYVSNLYKSELQEDKDKAKALRAKPRYYIPIISRDEIKRGNEPKVYFWGISPTVYETIIKFCLQEDYGDIANAKAGHDVIVEYTGRNAKEIWGKTSVFMKPAKTPLLEDMALAQKLYDECPNILDIFKELSTEELLEKVQKLVDGKEEDPTATIDQEVAANESLLTSKLKDILSQ
jgi:hypothetical protein